MSKGKTSYLFPAHYTHSTYIFDNDRPLFDSSVTVRKQN